MGARTTGRAVAVAAALVLVAGCRSQAERSVGPGAAGAPRHPDPEAAVLACSDALRIRGVERVSIEAPAP